jgi:hypothetical protein
VLNVGRTVDVKVKRNGIKETMSFPLGDDLMSAARQLSPAHQYSESEAIHRFAEGNGTSVARVIETILGGEELGRIKVDRFLTNTNIRPLFSPIVEDGLRKGLNRVAAQYEDLIARTIQVDQMSYEWYQFDNGATGVGATATGVDEFRLRRIAQAGPIPVARVTISGKSISLVKQGRGIEWTDESKMAPIDLAQLWFEQVGIQLGWDYYATIIDNLLNGFFPDNSDDAPVIPTATPAVITLVDLLTAARTMTQVYGYTANRMLMSLARSISVETMENGAGQYVFPNGTMSRGLPPIQVASGIPNDKILFVDTDFALVRYVAKPFGTEFDRSVQTQVEGSYGTSIEITTVYFPNARVILDS